MAPNRHQRRLDRMKAKKAAKATGQSAEDLSGQISSLVGNLEGLGQAAELAQELPKVLEEVERLTGELQIALKHTNGLHQELVDQRRVFLHMLSEMTDATPEELEGRYEDVYNLLKSEHE